MDKGKNGRRTDEGKGRGKRMVEGLRREGRREGGKDDGCKEDQVVDCVCNT